MSPHSLAHCTFDIYGYVTYSGGNAASDASVTDHVGQIVTTNANGFYDLNELEPGSYRVTADTSSGCTASRDVHDSPVGALVNGGTRADIQVACPIDLQPVNYGRQSSGPGSSFARSGASKVNQQSVWPIGG